MKKATIIFLAGVFHAYPVWPAAAGQPNGSLARYQTASNQERAMLCNSAMFAMSADTSNAATLHGGVDRTQAEEVWTNVNQLLTKAFVFDQIARSMGTAEYEATSKSMMDSFVAAHVANDKQARAEEAELADFCGRRMYDALRATDPKEIARLEALFQRVQSVNGNEVAKNDFLKRAMQPYHDD